jgi:protein O-GlcNAc transferase
LALQHAGDAEAAIREFRVALDREPDYFDAHLNLASALMEGGRLAEGRVHLDAAVALQPRSSNDYNNLSRLFFLLRDFPQTRAYLDEAIRADPTNFEPYNNLGCVLVEEGRAAEAIPHFQRSLELRANADTHSNLGDAFEQAGDLPGARANFSAALRLDPAHARAAERLRRLDTRP